MATATDKLATDTDAAVKAASDKAAHVAGARTVANAITKFADAAIAELEKSSASLPGEFNVTGVAGGRFTIIGEGFSSGGTVKFGGVQAHTVEWGPRLINGYVPAGAQFGEVTVSIDEKTVKRGYWRA